MLREAMAVIGPQAPVSFPATAYYLPVLYGLTGHRVEKLGDLLWPLEHAGGILPPLPDDPKLPYLEETLRAGMATLFAFETIEGVRFARGEQPEVREGFLLNGPIDDAQIRSWGVQMVDGRMVGFAVIIGEAKTNEVAVRIVRQFQSMGLLILLCGSIIDQLLEEGVELGYNTFVVPLGSDTISAIYAIGLAIRVAFSFGNVSPGDSQQILEYTRIRCPAFILALGGLGDLEYAAAAGALNCGFPVVADAFIPDIDPNLVSMPFDEIKAADDMERADRMVKQSIQIRGIKPKIVAVPIPVPYGPAFEGEIIRRADLHAEFGGKGGLCFEWLTTGEVDGVEDGRVAVVGPDLDDIEEGANIPLGIVAEVAGQRMQKEFESVIERQIHHLINGADGIEHIAQRDITWIRINKAAFERGLRIRHLGDIIYRNLHNDFGAIVDKIQVTLYTERVMVEELIEKARAAYRERDTRMAGLTDDAVDTFYSCTLCQSFAPNHVCIVSPERAGLCGAYTWLDCRTAYELNPKGSNQPVPKGRCIDQIKGEWEGVNSFVYEHSNRSVERFTLYSLMDAPTTTCGCCECVMIIVPEANGVMIVSRDDYSMTPSGMTFTTLMGVVGGGHQNPGMIGHSKFYITSRKFISADGGIKRVVWLSRNVKEGFAEEFKEACEREGVPDLMEKIADGTTATTLDELISFLEEKGHPALGMGPLI